MIARTESVIGDFWYMGVEDGLSRVKVLQFSRIQCSSILALLGGAWRFVGGGLRCKGNLTMRTLMVRDGTEWLRIFRLLLKFFGPCSGRLSSAAAFSGMLSDGRAGLIESLLRTVEDW